MILSGQQIALLLALSTHPPCGLFQLLPPLGQVGTQNADPHSGTKQSALLTRIFLSTSTAESSAHWFVKLLALRNELKNLEA